MARASGSYPEGRWFDSTRRYHFYKNCLWTFSSAGRASALQAEGHRFEPYNVHHGPVVQLVRMPACHAGGRRFEPVPDRQLINKICWCGSTVEQLICNQQVGGSIPSTSSKKAERWQERQMRSICVIPSTSSEKNENSAGQFQKL